MLLAGTGNGERGEQEYKKWQQSGNEVVTDGAKVQATQVLKGAGGSLITLTLVVIPLKSKHWSQGWPVGLVAWFSLRVREVPGSTPGQAPFYVFLKATTVIKKNNEPKQTMKTKYSISTQSVSSQSFCWFSKLLLFGTVSSRPLFLTRFWQSHVKGTFNYVSKSVVFTNSPYLKEYV